VISPKAFDSVYKRFMMEKQQTESKLQRKRLDLKMKEENEVSKLGCTQNIYGSKKRVNEYIQKVEKEIWRRKLKIQKLKEQKSIQEEKQLQTMFKPKTNNIKHLTHLLPMRKSKIRVPHQEDDFTFEQNSKFEKEMYDFTTSNNIRLLKQMKKGLTFITQNKDISDADDFSFPLKGEDTNISALNQLTKSRSSKALFEGVTSEH
jgi:hypothetical protein